VIRKKHGRRGHNGGRKTQKDGQRIVVSKKNPFEKGREKPKTYLIKPRSDALGKRKRNPRKQGKKILGQEKKRTRKKRKPVVM